MSLHTICLCLIVVASSHLVLQVETRSYNNGLIFYDLATRNAFLPPTVSVSRGRFLSNIKFSDKGSIWSTFGKPCDCRGPLCGCCVGIKVKQYNFDQKMCANVSYVRPNEEINLEVFLNETQSAKYGVSARNPSPFCIPVMMNIPMSMCVQMSNVGLQGDNLNMCMDFIVRLESTQLFEMHFQCMQMGAQGVQWVGPGGAPVIPPSQSKIKDRSDNESEEYYDEEENAEDMNEIETGDEKLNKEPEEFENKAEEEIDYSDLKGNEGEDLQINEVILDEEKQQQSLKNVSKGTLNGLEHLSVKPGHPTGQDSSEVSTFEMLTHLPVMPVTAIANESVWPESSETLLSPVEAATEKQYEENIIMSNLKLTMATASTTVANKDIDSLETAATIATIMSTPTTTATAIAALATTATTHKTPEALATVAATATSFIENNHNDNSQDNDSDYDEDDDDDDDDDDDHDEEESDENEEDESETEVEDESVVDVGEKHPGEQGPLAVVNNANGTVLSNHSNDHIANNKDNTDNEAMVAVQAVTEEEDGGEEQDEDDDDDNEDDDEEDEEDNDDVDSEEEDSEETANEAPTTNDKRPQNNSFIVNTTLERNTINTTSSSPANNSVPMNEHNRKPDELINLNGYKLQLDVATTVNTSNTRVNCNKTSNSPSGSSSSSLMATVESTSIVAGNVAAADSSNSVNMSQITATTIPPTLSRKLLMPQRQSQPRQQTQTQRQHQHRREQQKRQQHWQYPVLHQQVQQHQHHLHNSRHQRTHRLYYGA